jgi:hypothetical protein
MGSALSAAWMLDKEPGCPNYGMVLRSCGKPTASSASTVGAADHRRATTDGGDGGRIVADDRRIRETVQELQPRGAGLLVFSAHDDHGPRADPSGNPHHYLQQVTDFALMVTGQDRARGACAALVSGVDLPRDWADHEFKTYVTLGNDARFADLLLHSRLLVLHAGQVGSRRWTAALRLLSTLSGPRMTIRWIRREFGDSFDMTGLRGR